MEIDCIFEKVKDRLFAVRFEFAAEDELDRAFSSWRKVEDLHSFFVQYRADLSRFEPTLKVRRAVQYVLEDAETMFDELITSAMRNNLDELFKPLDNREENDTLYDYQKMKAKADRRKSMLRLYAVRLASYYVVSGSAIKITNRMDRPHLRAELHKLELVRQHLQEADARFVYLDV